MKRKYKILIIIVVGAVITFFINSNTKEEKLAIVSLGDGVSLGMTSYDVVGTSYYDYLKDELEKKNNLKYFNNEFSIQHFTTEELNDYLEDNKVGEKTKSPIKQVVAKADVILINFGMDELIDLSIKKRINDKTIDNYLKNYAKSLENIRTFYDKEIIIVGLYSAYNLDQLTIFDINKKIKSLAGSVQAKFLDVSALALNQEYYSNLTSYYMNYKGHKAIYKELLKIM